MARILYKIKSVESRRSIAVLYERIKVFYVCHLYKIQIEGKNFENFDRIPLRNNFKNCT